MGFSRFMMSHSLSRILSNTYRTTRYVSPSSRPGFSRFTSSAHAPPSTRVSSVVDEISVLTLLEVADLTELLRKKLSIDEMPVMAVMMPGMGFGGVKGGAKGGAAAKGEEKAVEKTAFDLKLEGGYDAGVKIKIIKEVRACTALGLKEAKDLVEKAPTLLKKGVTKEEAETIIAKMKEIGAKVTME
ncbi:50S ribosomal protein L7/L12-like [Impatiens glandulifera]|uniref:50S ribosomal protein L7/L12-like n=1 Tax=Impatiens glandulifera TaxID=253017 RepID=UPI001FB0C9AE|nr:50S ribosomal protein L7/L12-like [Impatiens glandulifera]XP_047317976.1 50S ribosomal protein L7/L12-like [Impatiens glandulifera]